MGEARGHGEDQLSSAAKAKSLGLTQKTYECQLGAINHSASEQMGNWDDNAVLICSV